ncbi:hypothetical protein V2J23_12580 [Geobacillus thermoleovorans]|uniref:hypothetical protein n=1 Tax=Geobacillus thermoleovorans TaxID=33941 RepID=UPI00345C0EA8
MTKTQLEKLLAKNDDSLDNYATVEELSEAVIDYLLPDLDELGLTDAELEKLYNHFESLNYGRSAIRQKNGGNRPAA